MLTKWKTILTNWINCYFDESLTGVRNVSFESLINIISHLRENLNLDESKSSILEAHTVEEFITEKYPDFQFENGTSEPANEEDVYIVASLLLLFVCLNSKDVDIKNAMCSKLSIEDQETIMKFSKYLMECSPISYRDVENAITEACGQDIACTEPTNGRATVAETPPPLRSLHGEVRRLQAALDAERFDRNYLQDELARTNLKLEKLQKDKEQYKIEIVNLKSKISLCCGQEAETKADSGGEGSSKLIRQLQQIEEKLVETQGQLDDVQYERDTYKAKIDELKQERDKWLAFSQQEANRVSQLTSELETERCHVNSLKELVTELRQHNQLYRLDASQCEVDDPDTSLHSVHNSSICSEVCANVVEVQLGEERAKIVVLKQQIQSLQEQLYDLNRKSEEEKQSLERVVSERENEIFNLKHRINEEIEEKNNLKAHFSDQVSGLNNEMNELEQKLTNNTEHSRRIIEEKMQDIQTLQEEKLSLLQSLSNETTKLNGIITNLVSDLDSERISKANMRDDYENKIMKLNEKVLNRNNELVELQNKISEAGERLEDLHADLRRERQARQDTIEKYDIELKQVKEQNAVIENLLQEKTKEVEGLSKQLIDISQCKDELDKTFDECKRTIAGLHENCKQLEETKIALQNEIEYGNTKVEDMLKDIENMRKKFTEERNKLMQDIDERNATINTLHTQLQNEIEYKMKIQHELTSLQTSKISLLDDINSLNDKLSKLKKEIQDKDQTIEGLDLYLKEEKHENEKLKTNCEKIDEKLKTANNEIIIKDNHIKQMQSTLHKKMQYYEDEIRKYNQNFQLEHNKLLTVIEEKGSVQIEQEYLAKEKIRLENCLSEQSDEILQLRSECENFMEFVKENKMVIESLEKKLDEETARRIEIGMEFDTETSRLMARLNETEKTMKELKFKSNKCIEEKELEIQTLNVELVKLQKTIATSREKILILEKEKIALSSKLDDEAEYTKNLEKEYQNKCITMSEVTAELNGQIDKFKTESENLLKTVNDKQKEIVTLEEKVSLLNEELKKEIQHRKEAIEILEQEKEQLHFVLEDDNSNHEVILKEKDAIIEQLEDELKLGSLQLDSLQKDYEETVLTFEKYKVNTHETIDAKDNHIKELENSIEQLKLAIDSNSNEMKIMEMQMTQQIEGLLKDIDKCKSELVEEKAIKDTLESEKASLLGNKDLLERQLNEVFTDITVIKTDKDSLGKTNDMLSQQVMEEKSARAFVEEQMKSLQVECINLQQELAKEVAVKRQLVDDNECLMQQLVEEKSAKELAEQERQIVLKAKEEFESKFSHDKDNYSKQIVTLLEKHALLNKELESEKIAKQALEKEIERLVQVSKEQSLLNERIVEENEKLRKSNNSLISDVDGYKLKYENLTDEHRMLTEEKKIIEKVSTELNDALDEIKRDKIVVEQLFAEARERNEQYALEIKEKLAKLSDLDQQINELMQKCQDKEEMNTQLSNMLEMGIKKIFEDIKKEQLQNEVLQKLIGEEFKSNHDKCECLIAIAETLTTELSRLKKIGKSLKEENSSLIEIKDSVRQKELIIHELQNDNKKLHNMLDEKKIELMSLSEANTTLESKQRDFQKLQHENEHLHKEFDDVKVQLEIEIQSLNDKIIDKEIETDKLKKDLESKEFELRESKKEKEIEVEKMREQELELEKLMESKKFEVEQLRKEKELEVERLKETKNLELERLKEAKELEVEKLKQNLEIAQLADNITHKLQNDLEAKELEMERLKEVKEAEVANLRQKLETVKSTEKLNDKIKKDLEAKELELEMLKEAKEAEVQRLKQKLEAAERAADMTEILKKDLQAKELDLEKLKEAKEVEMKMLKQKLLTAEHAENLVDKLKKDLHAKEMEVEMLKQKLETTENAEHMTDILKKELEAKELKLKCFKEAHEAEVQSLKQKLEAAECGEKLTDKLKKDLEANEFEVEMLKQKLKRVEHVENMTDKLKRDLEAREIQMERLKEAKEFEVERLREENELELERLKEVKEIEVQRLKQKLEMFERDEAAKALRNEKEALVKAAGGHVDTYFVVSYEKPSSKLSSSGERDAHHNQVDNTSDYTQSSMESFKTISDLEKIIHDKNRTITTLQSDVTYMKTLLAESENRLLDVTKELEISKENCYQLSTQLKKIVHQKNEEIAELKKQVSKMSVTENRATQIIKVSAKYQAIILKRIAEIKNNTVLKELTNYGNSANCDNDLRRSLTAGTITMEDLENFLETTERHIRKCSEKQQALQKERDRLTEVNRINESEIIGLKKFLTELSVSYKTFSNIKELYARKLSGVVSIQRTVRREILSLDGHVTDATMCKLERGYAAVMQDLSECCMNMERWVERCLGRTISPEKIKQAFSSDSERASLASTTFQNASLEVQLDEMEKSFQRLLEEVIRARKGEGAKEAQAVTVMEVRAEYEDKLNRMKAKMKQLYQEQIAVFQEKQKQEIRDLERELQAARNKLADSSKAYEEHIRGLTMELWDVGQKFLVKKDEAEWLRRKQQSGSLMSLQHVHSSGLVPPSEEISSRPSDTHSLRSLPTTHNANTNTNSKREGRGLHMSDEEGEVFDNRWLKELSSTPRRPPSPRESGLRLSELRWRNSLCPPHLKSSYPAETQFAPVIDEEDIKCVGTSTRQQRKEVGITAYKKPGPPTPSKQAGRLSATDSELRESLRVESDPSRKNNTPPRKTSTPSRIRALFKKHDTTDGTPRTKRLSIFRKK